jgi:glucokinase
MTSRDNWPVLSVDIGGTKVLIALFSPDGQILARDVIPTLVKQGVNSVIERIHSAIDSLLIQKQLAPPQLCGIGIACAGGIDTGRGMVVTPSPNMPGWENVPLRHIMEEKFHIESCVVNDASAAALGEHRFGAGRGVNHLVLLTLGTGIGGGIIADGRLYLGAVGAAAELGHMTIDADGPKCRCGNTGCLEMLASGTAVARETVNRLNKGEKSSLVQMVGGNLGKITAEQVGRAGRKGDALAIDILSRAAYYLGIGMVNVVNIFNPEMIVIGGGMAGLGEMLIGPGRRMVMERAFSISSGIVRIVTAGLGNDAGIYGAAVFARESAKRRKG